MNAIIVPIPKLDVSVRAATPADLPFLDALQKRNGRALGYFPTKQFEGYIETGGVLVAEAGGAPVGYVIHRDRYLKRDELGVIYQLCVGPGEQRKLVGASLVRAAFERSAYGCRLYCCWCAQDLAANYFWESLGFVPIAFRGGSERKSRVHIFWQRRIREGDATTPYWFPAKTDNGAMREDRLVLPIPPGVHWRDEMPRVVASETPTPALDDQREPCKRRRAAKAGTPTDGPVKHGPRQYGPPPATLPATQTPAPTAAAEKPKPQKKPKVKADPKLVAAARELRDRWLEQVNAGVAELPAPQGKYDLTRRALPPMPAPSLKALPHAA